MGFVSDVVDGITGKSGSKAAEKASQQQYQSTQDAINFERESRDLARGDLQPYADAGKARLGTLSALADQPADTGYNALTEALGSARPDWTGAMIHGALQNYGMPTTNISRVGDVGTSGFGTGPEAKSVLQGESGRTNWSDRLQEVSNTSYRDLQGFNDASDAMSRQVMGNNAARGKLGSGATLNDLFQQNAALGESMRGNRFNETLNAANTDESQFNNAFNRRLSDAGYRESVRANQAGEALQGYGINAGIRNSMVGENYGIAALNQAATNDAYNRTMGIANFDENVDNNAFSRLFDTQSFGQQANNTDSNLKSTEARLSNAIGAGSLIATPTDVNHFTNALFISLLGWLNSFPTPS